MKPDVPTQFSCVSVDPSGEIVVAGGVDPYDLYCWNLQTGNLVEVISGHEAPISCLLFSPTKNVVYTGSWDSTLRVHDLYTR
jgi:periodic tryptophan protein 2